jgi:type IV pilus assembly protein PilX
MNRMQPEVSAPRSQRGAILVTSLLLLVILTVLGVAMMRMTNMQERMAGNTRDVNLSLQGAEAALRDGEERVLDLPNGDQGVSFATDPACVVCQANTLPVAIYDDGQYDWRALAQEYGAAGAQEIEELAEDPRYVIGELGFAADDLLDNDSYTPSGRTFFQITGFSSGATGLTNTVLQSTFPRRF